jgi:hypothetical protein
MASKNTGVLVMSISIAVATMGAGFFLALAGGSDSANEAPRPQVAVAPQVIEATPPIPAPTPPEVIREPAPRRAQANRPNRMTRDVKREQIWSALAREHQLAPAAPGSAAPDEKDAAKLPALDREYIRSAITEQLLPVAIECYESTLEDDPKLAGKIVVEFTIVGVEEVGGVVEDASIVAEESTLDSEFVRECMRESLMAVTFEPPTDGGQVQVKYPFEFAR